jgi:ABC-type transport system involved in cytochrome bd biosynthesis fused ATPase/permease subunit
MVRQGEFVTLLGPLNSGKASVLRLLGGAILPDPRCLENYGGSSTLTLPSHLRILHISPNAMFFRGSLLDNLTFGVNPGDPDAHIERVIKVCRRLRLSDQIIRLLSEPEDERNEDAEERQWISWLSTSERALLNLARAFVANFEVLCLHKPTSDLDDPTSSEVMTLLRAFVEEKGIEQDPMKWHLRRPRTCIITSNKVMSTAIADKVYLLSRQAGLHVLTKEEINMLTDDPQCLTEAGLLTKLSTMARETTP